MPGTPHPLSLLALTALGLGWLVLAPVTAAVLLAWRALGVARDELAAWRNALRDDAAAWGAIVGDAS